MRYYCTSVAAPGKQRGSTKTKVMLSPGRCVVLLLLQITTPQSLARAKLRGNGGRPPIKGAIDAPRLAPKTTPAKHLLPSPFVFCTTIILRLCLCILHRSSFHSRIPLETSPHPSNALSTTSTPTISPRPRHFGDVDDPSDTTKTAGIPLLASSFPDCILTTHSH